MFALLHKPGLIIIPCPQIIKPHYLSFLGVLRNIASSSINQDIQNYPKNHSFVASYLMNNFGLSPQVAISKSLKVKFESSDKPDSVVSLLRDHGFDNTQISRIITKHPGLLVTKPTITLLPKLKFLSSIGASSDAVASNPRLLLYSLDNRLIPCYAFLKSMLLPDKQIVKFFRRVGWEFVLGLQNRISFNVKLLKEIQVPQKNISLLIYRSPRVLSRPTHKLKKLVEEVLENKIDTSKSLFVVALAVKASVSKVTWKHKIEVYKRWGLSEHEVLLAYSKHPECMSSSENKIMRVMDILVNKTGFHSSSIVRYPVVLSFSLESRIIPRCSVLRVLQSKGLIEDLSRLSFRFLHLTEKDFIHRFITKYQEQVPQLLTIYQGKLGILELGER